MDILMKEVKHIEVELEVITNSVTEVTKLQSNLYCSPFVTATDLKNMEKLSDQILTKSVQIRKDIEALSSNNNGSGEMESHRKVCVNQIERLSHQLREIMNKFRSNQADYIDKTRSRFQRKVDIVSKDDDPNIDMNNVDFQTHSVFTDDIIIQMQTAKIDLLEIEEREKELHKLESQIHEVNKLFKEMNVLVGEQGDMLNNIEKNVEDAVNHVTETKKQLRQAKEYKTKTRKKKIICGVILGVVIVTILVVIIVLVA
jgi:t-SNARE complex subunit (syntaxin)